MLFLRVMELQNNNTQMENLARLLEDYMEDVAHNVWAMWVDQMNYRGRHNVRAYLQDQNAMELHEPLMQAERNGLVSLVIDDCALIVNIL
jgi:endo-beta-N-acetylglucosaminidase D